jgi:predicted amidohydrolase YtcJ
MRTSWLTALVAIGIAGVAHADQPTADQPTADQPPADLLFVGGTVLTPDGTAAAIAVRRGMITAVGSDAAILALPHAGATVVQLGGATLMPGLYDMHVHTYFAGRDMLSCRFARGAGSAAIVAAVKACAARARPGEWIIGGSWVGAVFAPGEQNRALLDRVAPDNPVLLNDESLHSVWLNSRALAVAGIDRNTPDPVGGIIEHDAHGEPDGVLREVAAHDIERVIPAPSVDQQVAAVKAATDRMLGYGIVGFTDAAVRRDYIAGLSRYAQSGGLRQYARGCIVWGPNSEGSEGLIAERQAWAGGRLQLDCVKMFLDGVPLEGETAAMLAPYAVAAGRDGPHGMPGTGIKEIPEQRLFPAVADFDRQGLIVKFHAAGDAAVREAIDAVAYARQVNGPTGQHHEVAHNTFVDPADVPRGRALGMTWEMSPYIWYPTPITGHDIALAVGPERMKRLWPVREVVATAANVVVGSDWPVIADVNPWLAFETLVTRQAPGATGPAAAPDEAITRAQALTLLTANGAREMGRLDRGGTIEPGKVADVIVVDRNPLTVAVGDIHNTRVLATYIAGEQVYARKDAMP